MVWGCPMLVRENLLKDTTILKRGTHTHIYLSFNVTKYKGQTISFSLHREVIKGETPTFTMILYNVPKNKIEKRFTLNNTKISKLNSVEIPDVEDELLLLTYNGLSGETLGIDVEYSKPYLCIGETLPDVYIPAKADLKNPTLYPIDGEYEEILAS